VPPRKHLHKVPEAPKPKGDPNGNTSPEKRCRNNVFAKAAKGDPKGNPSAQKRCRKKNQTGYTSPYFGKLKLTLATARSYIQYWESGTGELKLLVAFSVKEFQDHPAAAVDVAVWIGGQSASLTKAMVVARRDSLIST